MKKDTALLIFARTSLEESRHKPFQKSKLFFEKQEARIFQMSFKLGIDLIRINEHDQVGNNFAERFCNAIQNSFQKGYQKLICIGNDTPHLQLKHLQSSLRQLQQGKASLGLNRNGGFYLLALHKLQFDYNTFFKFTWNTSKVGKEVFQFISKEKTVHLLPRFIDVNDASDFNRLRNSTFNLYKALQKLVFQYSTIVFQKVKEPLTYNSSLMVLSNKAPPYFQQ